MAAAFIQRRIAHYIQKFPARVPHSPCLEEAFYVANLKKTIPKRQYQVCRFLSVTKIRAQNEGKGKFKIAKNVYLDGDLTVKKLAKKMGTSAGAVIKVLQEVGEDIDKGIHTALDLDIAEFVVLELGATPILPDIEELEKQVQKHTVASESNLEPRPPVVTIMGHVDHGKTTLLDKLRETSVAQGEAGGITQHIGAFSVTLKSGKRITFIDTPGHAAFNAMRGRGAKVTDLVVLVVAADDGVKDQTLECIKHAQEANVPIVVAINKIDKYQADASRVKQELLQHRVLLEDFGGDVPYVEISALKGLNLDKLEETIITQAEVAELKADFSGFAQGVILEAETHNKMGLLATVLVQRGRLKKGSSILAGNAFAKVRQMFNDAGKVVNEASPSTPVQVLGWRALPVLGDQVLAVASEEAAKSLMKLEELKERRQIRQEFEEKQRKDYGNTKAFDAVKHDKLRARRKMPFRIKLRQQAASALTDDVKESGSRLSVIVKADYSGSLEAVLDILNSFKSDKIDLEVASSGVGQISENDVRMAEATKGVVYGFNVNINRDIDQLSKRLAVPVKNFSVIYKLMDDVQDELCSKLPQVAVENILGEAHVLKTFQLTGQRKAFVAGCRVKKGSLSVGKENLWRVCRDGKIIHQGPLNSLKHGQQDISIAKKETECGVAFEKFNDIKENDQIQCLQITYEKPMLNWVS
eukprot:gene20380-22389_t